MLIRKYSGSELRAPIGAGSTPLHTSFLCIKSQIVVQERDVGASVEETSMDPCRGVACSCTPSSERLHKALRSIWPEWSLIPCQCTYRQHIAADYEKWHSRVPLTREHQGPVQLDHEGARLLQHGTPLAHCRFYRIHLASVVTPFAWRKCAR